MTGERSLKSKSRRARGNGSIFFNERRGRWVGRRPVGKTVTGKTVYRECWGRTQAEVVKRLAAAAPPGPDATVNAWAARWWEGVSVRPTTRTNYTHCIEGHVLPHLGHLKLADVTAAHVEALSARLLKSMEPTTVVGVLAVARVMFGAAVRSGIIPRNPVALARKPRLKRRKVETLTPNELLRVIGAAGLYSGGGPVTLMAGVGCRVGEAIALDVPDFDPVGGTVAITRTAHPDQGLVVHCS
jgi:integrase